MTNSTEWGLSFQPGCPRRRVLGRTERFRRLYQKPGARPSTGRNTGIGKETAMMRRQGTGLHPDRNDHRLHPDRHPRRPRPPPVPECPPKKPANPSSKRPFFSSASSSTSITSDKGKYPASLQALVDENYLRRSRTTRSPARPTPGSRSANSRIPTSSTLIKEFGVIGRPFGLRRERHGRHALQHLVMSKRTEGYTIIMLLVAASILVDRPARRRPRLADPDPARRRRRTHLPRPSIRRGHPALPD